MGMVVMVMVKTHSRESFLMIFLTLSKGLKAHFVSAISTGSPKERWLMICEQFMGW